MEDQVRPDTVTRRNLWLVAPAFDLLFIANLGWVGALLFGVYASEDVAPIEFWQMYFLTTPHRWLTLFLVVLDPDRREGRGFLFASLPALFLCILLAVQFSFGVLLCLAMIDYIWNGWHFAAQHTGVLRIYGRKLGEPPLHVERHGLRVFVFYVILRTAGWSTGWLEHSAEGTLILHGADALIGLIGLTVVVNELRAPSSCRLPKRTYFASVVALYGLLLLALAVRWTAGITVLTVAAAAFHAIEYLGLVTHYAWQRRTIGSAGAFRSIARNWLVFLAGIIIVIGAADWLLRSPGRGWWVGVNLWAAFLHYAYDGLIWKLRKPATAQALGAGGAA